MFLFICLLMSFLIGHYQGNLAIAVMIFREASHELHTDGECWYCCVDFDTEAMVLN